MGFLDPYLRSAKDQPSNNLCRFAYVFVFFKISSFFSILVIPPWLKLILMKPVNCFFFSSFKSSTIFSCFSINLPRNVMKYPHSMPSDSNLSVCRQKQTADGYKHPSAVCRPRNVYSFPNTGGDAVSGGTHSPAPIAYAVGKAGRSCTLMDKIVKHYIDHDITKCQVFFPRIFSTNKRGCFINYRNSSRLTAITAMPAMSPYTAR